MRVSSEQQRRAAQKTNEWKECEELRSLVQNVTFEKMRGAVKKDRVGFGVRVENPPAPVC